MIKGFHVCKANNAPSVGQVKNLVVIGDRIKSKALDQGGQPYAIMSVVKRDNYKDSYDNLGFDLEIEPQNGAQTPHNAPQRATSGGWSEDRSNRIERQHSQEMAIRYAALKGATEMDTATLLDLIDWFQRDIGRSPERTPSQSVADPDNRDDTPEPSEEEQF